MRSASPMFDAVVVDLDGTIIDCFKRHYACYAEIAHEVGLKALDASTYRDMKREHSSWNAIFGAAAVTAEARGFETRFQQKIEEPRFLELDRMFEGSEEALLHIRKFASAVLLVTMRRRPEALQRQLEQLGIARLFDCVLCRGPSEGISKGALAGRALRARGKRVAWIGDTEEDIAAARATGALACSVTGGLRDRAYLESMCPDLLSDNLAKAVDLLATRRSETGRS